MSKVPGSVALRERPGSRLATVLLVSALGIGCGGEAFTADASAGGSAGARGGAGGSGQGGSAQGGSAQGGSAQGGAGQSGSAGSSEPDASAGGSDPGSGGAASGGQAGGGLGGSPGTGGGSSADAGIQLQLIDCGSDAFGTNIQPTLYTTLDSPEAITTPAIGELGFVGNSPDDYHAGRCGTAINIDEPNDHIKYHYEDNGYRHFNPVAGTIDFWLRPVWPHTDDLNHHLFATLGWDTVGGIRVRKAAADNQNALQVLFRDVALQVVQIEVPATEYTFTPMQWVRITIIWYLDPSLPSRYIRLFVDGALAGERIVPSTFTMEPDQNQTLLVGTWDFGDPENANGLLDDFKVFDRGP